jgi:hypothetical protein
MSSTPSDRRPPRSIGRKGSRPLCAAARRLALCGAAGLAGCLTIDPPPRFIETSATSSRLVLLSPDEARIVVQDFDVPGDGDLAFWRDSLRVDFVENRGYTLVEERPAAHSGGTEGHELIFETTIGGSPYRYLATLYHFDGWGSDTLRVAEFLAPKALFDGYLADVRAAVKTARTALWR